MMGEHKGMEGGKVPSMCYCLLSLSPIVN